MNGSLFLTNFINLFIVAIILETSISAFFSIAAIRMVDNKLVVKTTREAITYIITFLMLYFMKEFRIFTDEAFKVPELVNYIVTSLITVRLSLFIRDIFAKASR